MAQNGNKDAWKVDEGHYQACILSKGNCWNCLFADECGYWLENDWPIAVLNANDPALIGVINKGK